MTHPQQYGRPHGGQNPYPAPRHQAPPQYQAPQPPPPPALAEPPKKRKKWPWVLGGVFAFIMLSFVGCTALLGAAVNEVSKERTVTYSVEGKGSARISFWANGGMSSADNAKLPWSQKVTAPGYQFGSVTVTLDHNGGTVTCRITGEDGKVISENTGSGAFGTANCNGTANG